MYDRMKLIEISNKLGLEVGKKKGSDIIPKRFGQAPGWQLVL